MGNRERPIIFSAPMVRAILSGRKTQTRRLVFPRTETPGRGDLIRLLEYERKGCLAAEFRDSIPDDPSTLTRFCRYGLPGTRLWVRETWHNCPHCGAQSVAYGAGGWLKPPRVDGPERDDSDARPLAPQCAAHGWRPSIHMPRWASRITLEVTGVRVERLCSISEADAMADGIECSEVRTSDLFPGLGLIDGWKDYSGSGSWWPTPRESFTSLWESIHGTDSWALNPWVWVVEFRRLLEPEDLRVREFPEVRQ